MRNRYRNSKRVIGYSIYRVVLIGLYCILWASSYMNNHELGTIFENQLLFLLILPAIMIGLSWIWLPTRLCCMLSALHGMLLLILVTTTYMYMLFAHIKINSLSLVACVPILPLIIEGICMMLYIRRNSHNGYLAHTCGAD